MFSKKAALEFFLLAFSFQLTSAASTSTCVTFTQNLSFGSKHSEVASLQKFLVDSGYTSVRLNGTFDWRTESAVKKFQTKNNNFPSGVLGPIGRAKINELSCASDSINKNISTASIPKIAANDVASTTKLNSAIMSSVEEPGYKIFEFEKKYDYVNRVYEIDGKFVFHATKDDLKKRITSIVYDGKEVSTQGAVVDNLVKVGKFFAYSEKKDGKTVIIYSDGRKEDKGCLDISGVVNIGEKIAYHCHKQSYKAGGADGQSIVFGNQVINNAGYLIYPQTKPVNINKKIAYVVGFEKFANSTTKVPEWTKETIFYNGSVIDKMYDRVMEIFPYKGNLAYVASNNGKMFIVANGEVVTKEYAYIQRAEEINGKIAFLASDMEGGSPLKNYLVYDGKEYGKEYYDIASFYGAKGKLGYQATVKKSETSYSFVSIYDGQMVSKEKYVSLTLPDTNLTKRSYGDMTADIYYKDKLVGSGYDDRATIATYHDGKAVFYATKNGKGFIISE